MIFCLIFIGVFGILDFLCIRRRKEEASFLLTCVLILTALVVVCASLRASFISKTAKGIRENTAFFTNESISEMNTELCKYGISEGTIFTFYFGDTELIPLKED